MKLPRRRKVEHQEFPRSWGVLECVYDHQTKSLYVEVFNHGKTEWLKYGEVPVRVYEGLKKAESKGGYFNREIRDTYQYLGKA